MHALPFLLFSDWLVPSPIIPQHEGDLGGVGDTIAGCGGVIIIILSVIIRFES